MKIKKYEKGMIRIKKDILIVLGNGFSIDLINHLKKSNEINIDLTNLFLNGDKVSWPADNVPGFLSCERCPALWQLGAKPNIDRNTASKIIEDIITCANVNAYSKRATIPVEATNIYIRAYHELVSYLKYLFIYYNNILDDSILNIENLKGWGWSGLLSNLNTNSNITSIDIVTYNYDILLERVLDLLNAKYSLSGFKGEIEDCKFKIIKPHGSISFRSAKKYDKESFSIKYNRDGLGGKIEDLIIDNKPNFDIISNINTMIPPAGESERYQFVWSKVLKKYALESAEKLKEDDEVIFGGISYCNVDRKEIDEELIKLDADVKIKLVNPDTNYTFGSVISSIFGSYVHYTNSDILGGLYND